ncbi:MAG: type II toxin-antitoxin system HicB family antitoxin [Verrucomicrobiales bacterium]
MKYVLIIETAEPGYSGYFPDLPGCITAGETLDEVRSNAVEALELHLEDEPDLPPARALAQVLADSEVDAALDGSEFFTSVDYHGQPVASA